MTLGTRELERALPEPARSPAKAVELTSSWSQLAKQRLPRLAAQVTTWAQETRPAPTSLGRHGAPPPSLLELHKLCGPTSPVASGTLRSTRLEPGSVIVDPIASPARPSRGACPEPTSIR